jgi:hypothetical protein
LLAGRTGLSKRVVAGHRDAISSLDDTSPDIGVQQLPAARYLSWLGLDLLWGQEKAAISAS